MVLLIHAGSDNRVPLKQYIKLYIFCNNKRVPAGLLVYEKVNTDSLSRPTGATRLRVLSTAGRNDAWNGLKLGEYYHGEIFSY